MKTLAVFCAISLTACASSGRTGGNFTRNIGTATEAELLEMSHRVLALHQFEIERQEQGPSIYLETRWRNRVPFEDEAPLGVEAAQVRTIIRGRPRSSTSPMGLLYSVDIKVEQRLKVLSQADWVQNWHTRTAAEYAGRIVEDLRRELQIGVRRY